MSIKNRTSISAPMITLIFIIFLWEVLGRIGIFTRLLLPPFSDALIKGIENFDAIKPHILITVYELFVAFSIVVVLGIGIGFLIGLSRALREGFVDILSALYSMPLIILYPTMVFIVGLGPESKIALGVLYGFFPIALNVIAGMKSISGSYYMLFYYFRASQKQILTKLVLRGALSSIIAGLRIGLALTTIGVVAGEILASYGGLGYLIRLYENTFRAELIWFNVIIVLIIVATIVFPLKVLEDRLSRWKVS